MAHAGRDDSNSILGALAMVDHPIAGVAGVAWGLGHTLFAVVAGEAVWGLLSTIGPILIGVAAVGQWMERRRENRIAEMRLALRRRKAADEEADRIEDVPDGAD